MKFKELLHENWETNGYEQKRCETKSSSSDQ